MPIQGPDQDLVPLALPEDVRALPTTKVKEFARRLAAAHRITYCHSRLDNWAEAVTRSTGVDLRLDQTGGLLVRLKQCNVLNAAQFTRLLINHRRESGRPMV